MNFQEITVTIATIVLILILVMIGYLLSNNRGSKKFPPVISACPDYWTSKGDNVCENKHGLGICKAAKNDNVMDFNEEGIFKGQKGMYYKCAWAKKCEVPWEGIDSLC